MDPLETVKIEKDTSFILMLGAYRRGHRVYYLPEGGMTLKDGKVYFRVVSVVPQDVVNCPFIKKEMQELSSDEVGAVFVRSDPPFDETYLMNTWLLERLPAKIPVINRPAGIRTVNEKLWATQFVSITPKTIVSRDKNDLTGFLKSEKDVIAKPTDGFGGASVFRVRKGDPNANVILETVSRRWTKDIILQKYIPAAQKGDKRILLLNGEPLGAVLRVHAKGEHRNNFFAGGTPAKTTITANDKKIIRILKPELKKLGLYFVGIDIIGRYLIEVNVTSPTCLREMNRLYNKNLEYPIIEFAKSLAVEYQRKKKSHGRGYCRGGINAVPF